MQESGTNENNNKLMKDNEKKTEQMVKDATKSDIITNPIHLCLGGTGAKVEKKDLNKSIDVLVGIMQDGANEFKEKTGRNMTYSEMRSMYG